MEFYFITLDGRTSQYSVMLRLLSSEVFSLDVSHSEFNLNSINTDEDIFMDMILAPEVAPEMTHKSEDERSKLIGEA